MSNSWENRIRERLTKLQSEDRLREPRTVTSLPNGRCQIDGREMINFGGNDYLNLAFECGIAADTNSISQIGSTASALVTGRSPLHAELESALAKFEGTDAALLFPTGFAANLGVLQSLVEASDAVFCDRDNHASLIDAARTCPGKFQVFQGDQLDRLRATLQRRRSQFDQVFLVTDGVFSMDGRAAELTGLVDIANEFDCRLIVDEAHGTGVLGINGRGAGEHCGVHDRIDVHIGTLSKALGGLGGFVCGPADLIRWLRNSARSQFFSTALPPFVCQAMLQSIRTIQEEPSRRDTLQQLTEHAHAEIRRLDLKTVPNGIAPIVPIIIGDEARCVKVSQSLQQAGFFVPAIRPPTVRPHTSRLRLSINIRHTPKEITAALTHITTCLANH